MRSVYHVKDKMTESNINRRVENWTRRVEDEGQIIGGAIMVWLGITFLLSEMNYISYNMWWPVFATGMGVVLVAKGVLGYRYRYHRSDANGYVIGGAVFLILGLGSFFSFHNWWPMILILIGISTIVGADR
jgi:hypothetical protein